VLAVVALFGCEFNAAVEYLNRVRERAVVLHS